MTKQKPSGTILICILVSLVIVAGITGSMLKNALEARKAMRNELRLRQTEFILDAAVQRAAAKLQKDPDYDGEVWQLENALPNADSAQATIEVVSVDEAQTSNVKVTAQISGPQPIQRTYTFSLSNEESL